MSEDWMNKEGLTALKRALERSRLSDQDIENIREQIRSRRINRERNTFIKVGKKRIPITFRRPPDKRIRTVLYDKDVIHEGKVIKSDQLYNNRSRVQDGVGPAHSRTPKGVTYGPKKPTEIVEVKKGGKTLKVLRQKPIGATRHSTWDESTAETWANLVDKQTRHINGYLRIRGSFVDEFHCISWASTVEELYRAFFFANEWFLEKYNRDTGQLIGRTRTFPSKNDLYRAWIAKIDMSWHIPENYKFVNDPV